MMPARSFDRRAEPCPIIDFGVPFMFEIQTELHLRRLDQDAPAADHGRIGAAALLVLASLSGLTVLAAALG
ncbi:hypothetical protein [Paracoccus sp. S3-43]|uniref:hypothetical protein n=1 Tax=Paracoccus sp. S3-43 TaxID=3030011 RepID=UPI0023B0867E|nr:hypothetical protein [Paracoccus sp. S3-43]WEF24898.1 hypothetical protein PXD02_02775 [Paracoccus sp. S3-43]